MKKNRRIEMMKMMKTRALAPRSRSPKNKT